MNLLVILQAASPTPGTIGFPELNLSVIFVHLLALIPLIGGYLLAREGKGNVPLEAGAVILLVLATVVPATITLDSLPGLLTLLINKLPVVVFLLGLALVRDGGFRMIVGLGLMVVSGLVLLPRG
jgi:hypothetical protein